MIKTGTKTKIIFYWILIGVCFILHNSLHELDTFYGKNTEIIDASGVIPLGVHIFTILTQMSPFILAFLFLNFSNKGFLWGAMVWSILFLILNIVHLVETIAIERPFNLSQVVLLSFIVLINIMLTLTIWKYAGKSKPEEV